MKLVKLIAPMLILFIAFNTFAQEQTRKTPEERAKNQTKAIDKECQLTPEQKTKVEQIILSAINQTKEVRQKDIPRRDKMIEIKKINEDRDLQMKSTLTPDQYAKYQALVEKMKAKTKERMQARQEARSDGDIE